MWWLFNLHNKEMMKNENNSKYDAYVYNALSWQRVFPKPYTN